MLIPFFLVAGSIFAVLHIIASELYLYWRFEWFDIPMHFYGGLVVVLGIFALASRNFLVKERWLTLTVSLVTLMIFASVWELYELMIGATVPNNYVLDTILDFVMGIAGATFGYYFCSHFYHSKI